LARAALLGGNELPALGPVGPTKKRWQVREHRPGRQTLERFADTRLCPIFSGRSQSLGEADLRIWSNRLISYYQTIILISRRQLAFAG
jgi:hypothetical protein